MSDARNQSQRAAEQLPNPYVAKCCLTGVRVHPEHAEGMWGTLRG